VLHRNHALNVPGVAAGTLLLTAILVTVFDTNLAPLFHAGPQAQGLVLAGYWLGHGLFQVGILGLLYALGQIFQRPKLRMAAGRAMLAWAAAGAAAQLLKHLIGRPRPRLWAEGVAHLGPTLAGGLDSFPSGHTATSIAVALVLSLYCPRLTPLFMALAAFVAASRMLGGSHFPLDVAGGLVLGLVVGLTVVYWGWIKKIKLHRFGGARP
jgi:membrane-associated phospholipid phosphatase